MQVAGNVYAYKLFVGKLERRENYFRNLRVKMKNNIKVSLLAFEHTDVG